MPLPVDLAALVRQREPTATRQDLVLPKLLMRVLDRIVLQWRAHTQDGAADAPAVGSSARGISVLFAGPRGTGKTLAAEVLAHETRLELFRVDLSRIASRYIGETEKNLTRLFNAAEAANALLYFDEADALFGKRSEVKDSHDRYANLESNVVLQHIERFHGIAILATHLRENIEPAVLQRLGFVMDFALPDLEQRTEIWRRIFPPDTPVEGLDPERLARLPLCGADIRNIARSSTALAASEGQPVRMAHLLRAAIRECARLDRPIDLTAISRP